MHPLAQAALGAAAVYAAQDTFLKPARVARLARGYADRTGKPLLTFVRPMGSTLKSMFTESLAMGDVNLHPSARPGSPTRGRVVQGNPWRLPVRNRAFGAVFSHDVLEHLDRPDLALAEWHRIADKVFVVVPAWWSPEAWFAKWYIDGGLRRAYPLWIRTNRTVLLPSGQSRAYAATTCPTPSPRPTRGAPPQKTTNTKTRSTRSPEAPVATSNVAPPAPMPPMLPQAASEMPEPVMTSSSMGPEPELDLREPEDMATSAIEDGDLPFLPLNVGTHSSLSGVSTMMIVSSSF